MDKKLRTEIAKTMSLVHKVCSSEEGFSLFDYKSKLEDCFKSGRWDPSVDHKQTSVEIKSDSVAEIELTLNRPLDLPSNDKEFVDYVVKPISKSLKLQEYNVDITRFRLYNVLGETKIFIRLVVS